MDRTWIIDGPGLAEMVKNAGRCSSANEINYSGGRLHVDDVSGDSPGLPAGVKFDPSDVELLKHLAAKSCVEGLEPDKLIDLFIPTLESDELGICYTHPENLPGAKKDGSSVHFFYKISNAYATGKRKRRRIENQENDLSANVRWHKTGKTKVVMHNGVHRGCKKIMVLYSTSKRGTKAEKCKWIMHQYHLGNQEDEKPGEYVVAKVFYQPETENDKSTSPWMISESEMGTIQIVPRTPNMISTPEPFWEVKTGATDFGTDDCSVQQDLEKDGVNTLNGLAVASHQPAELEEIIDRHLVCVETVVCSTTADGYNQTNVPLSHAWTNSTDVQNTVGNGLCGITDLKLGTPPYLQVNDLQFASDYQEVFAWLAQI